MPEKHIPNQEKLSFLRQLIARQGLDGFILPRTDEFMGEFLAPYAERLAYLTGFTGSAGYTIVLSEAACVMSDGRYTIQLKKEVDQTLFEVGNSITTPAIEWIEAKGGGKIGYDPFLHTLKDVEEMEKAAQKTVLVALAQNPVDMIWQDQPPRPAAPVFLFPNHLAGKTSQEKRNDICVQMDKNGADVLVLTLSDSICWLLNVRGSDVSFSPLVLSYVLLWKDGSLDWFIDPQRTLPHVVDIRVKPLEALEDVLAQLKDKTVWLDPGSAPIWFYQKLLQSCAKILREKDPCLALKAIKTHAEQEGIRQAHVKDGVALLRFMKWLSETNTTMSEISVADMLESFRKEQSGYAGPSFSTIAGFADHGAIIHYRAAPQSAKVIEGDGLLLLDSGGQYSDGGTTDITRTFAIGTPTPEMCENYTRVLKGHIALTLARFPVGTTGAELDVIARQPLWDAGLDYAHGTGHGVGCFLGVHEEAANISPRGNMPLAAGMVLSNEPGYYKEGHYGIRIENLLLVVPCGVCAETQKNMLGFETLTLSLYDPKLIVAEMLEAQERAWLAAYYQQVQQTLFPHLQAQERAWLVQQLEQWVM